MRFESQLHKIKLPCIIIRVNIYFELIINNYLKIKRKEKN